ncbi:MAG: hypothetical protein AB1597_08320 [Chloroflexota bacterium]
METILEYLTQGVFSYILYSAAWLAATVISVIMLLHGGGKVERLLLTGSSLMLVSSLLNLPTIAIHNWLVRQGFGLSGLASILGVLSLAILAGACIGLAGIILIVYAFWTRARINHVRS